MKHWVTIWAQAHTDLHMIRSYLRGKTARTSIPSCVTGAKLRLHFSNREGRSFFVLRDATVCIGSHTYTLTFGGNRTLTLAPGKDTVVYVWANGNYGDYTAVVSSRSGSPVSGAATVLTGK